MKFIEKFSVIFFVAGFLFFIVATISLGWIPARMTQKLSADEGIPAEVPENFKSDYPNRELYAQALYKGRDIYIKEACWHCHSQFVRPVANENLMYGPVSTPGEYQNLLNRPQLFGTRRVGPDLSREAGKRTNDWHYAHLYQPTSVEPQSVMPSYAWYFEIKEGIPVPKEEAKALVAYLQWLGSSVMDRKENANDYEQETLPPSE